MNRNPVRQWVWWAMWTFAAGGVAFAARPSPAAARYPEKAVHLIVPYPQGGAADFWARIVAEKLSQGLHQPVVVDNLPGRGGNIGTAAAAVAPADGYTLLLGSVGPLAVHPFTYVSLPFDPIKNFVPIALLESSPMLIVASATAQVASASELITRARAEPGMLSFASNGNGSPEHVAGELFKKRLKLDIHHLPYDGAGPARKAVLAGQASIMFDPSKGALPAIRKGLQTPLAVAARARLSVLPQVPTFAEIGVPRYELRIWTGVLAPVGTPKAIVDKLNKIIRAILQTPEILKEITEQGGEVGAMTPAGFATFLATERRQWSALVEESAIPKVQ
jgi:tripartite-type tricarboxylate transporter receptor subunit TctC